MKRKILFILILAIAILGELMGVTTLAMRQATEPEFRNGQVIASKLNVRNGPSKEYGIVGRLNEGEYIQIHAKIDDWYVVQTSEDVIGCVSAEYVQQANLTVESGAGEYTGEITSALTEDEKQVLELINAQRTANGLNPLQIDDDLQNVARIKAQDMVDNNYFAHESPTYGSPFDMIKSNQITYKVAGENIAGNSDNEKAVEAWMNSESHKNNILNNGYNYTGIAVVSSPKYGKLFVQMFIGK